MDLSQIPAPSIKELFRIEVQVADPIVVGQDEQHGNRQLIPILSGRVSGKLNGIVMPGGVDSQVIRPDGLVELSARYALQLDDGNCIYIENNGMRRADSSPVYFATVAHFETYSETYRWLERSVIISYGTRLPSSGLLRFCEIV